MLASWPNRILLLLAAGGILAAVLTVGQAVQLTVRTRQVAVQRGVVQSTVSATGSLQSPQAINVGFSSGGTLTHVFVKVGQSVLAHDLLATIDPTTTQRSLDSARAGLASAQGHLQQTLHPLSSPEQRQLDVAVAQNRSTISGAQRSLVEARAAARQDRRSQVLAVGQARALLANARLAAAQDARGLAAALAQANAQLAADQAQQNIDLAAQTSAQATANADAAKLVADQAKQTADGCAPASSSPLCAADAAAISQDNSRLSADNAKIGSATADANKVAQDQNMAATAANNQAAGAIKDAQSITQADGAHAAALSAQSSAKLKDDSAVAMAAQQLATAQGQLQATIAGNGVKAQPPKPGDLASAQAGVKTAQLSVAAAQQALDETQLRAPASGVVGSVSGVVGETVGGGSGGSAGSSAGASGASSSGGAAGGGAAASSGGSASGGSSSSSSSGTSSSGAVVSLTSLHGLQLAAGFSESDATKIKVGQAASVTVDALPSHQIGAHVLQLSPTPGSSSGVVTYSAVFGLDQPVAGLKPGMSASVSVVAQQVEDALNVPSAALSRGRGGQTVSVQQGSKQMQVPVIVGLRGDSSVEILSGLREGEEVTITSAPVVSVGAGGGGGGGLPTGGGLGAGGFGGGGGGGLGRAARGG
ncbi:MAG: hypothetical protein ACR2ND_09585 [Solirubrobacteraceae bacterium]